MRVLIVFNHPAPYKVRLFNELGKYVDLTVIFERKQASDRNKDFYLDKPENFKCITLTTGYIGKEGSLSSQVKDYIKKHSEDFDYIIMNGYSHIAEIKAIDYMQSHKIKYGLMVNGGFVRKEGVIKRRLKTRLISGASFYFSPTNNSDSYLCFYGAEKNQVFRYPYSNISEADLNGTNINIEETRKEFNIPINKRVFVNSSQFIERKNNLALLSLFKNRDEILLLIGEGKELKKYQKFINQNNMSNVIIMPYQNRERLFKILKCCDTFISLAKEDIYGQTIIEALANGLPVIASNKINSALEYIKDDFNGYLVDLENIGMVSKFIEKTKDLQRKNSIFSVKSLSIEVSAKTLYDILSKGI